MLTLLLAAAAAAQAAPASLPTVEPDVTTMSPRDIKAFNMTVPANHPFHIRCRSEVEIGSLVKRITTCKTNRQWVKADQIANDDARDIGDRMASKAMPGGN